MKVHIVSSSNPATVSRNIEEMIKTGWKIQGNLVVTGAVINSTMLDKSSQLKDLFFYSQMMIKEED